MVLGEAVAFSAAGAHALFGYNRENFLYDRKQRQEMEFKVLEWRCAQAELWRDDVREVIGLTEKKMDTYLIVNTLQLGMCVGLFAEGRLEPGTPPWLLHLYMLTLGAAFMYLLMSVWLAMHASIVASCSSVRLLTQFVRLPIPTWEQLEQMRTYAQAVESLDAGSLLRVPFTGQRAPGQPGSDAVASRSKGPAGSSSALGPEAFPADAADPWGWELHGDHRGLYELMEQPAALRRHISLAQRAARQYQCFDAFARVAMSFGTNQLLSAISYYVMGYVAVQDGAPVPACSVVLILASIAVGIVQLDFSLTGKEQTLAKMLVLTGPLTSAIATFIWVLHQPQYQTVVMGMLPVAYASHGLWLFFALITCGLELQENGSVLPMRFRAVLYLDVFGWLPKGQLNQRSKPNLQQEPLHSQPHMCGVQSSGKTALPQKGPGKQVKFDKGHSDGEFLCTEKLGAAAAEGARRTASPLSPEATHEQDGSPKTTTPLLHDRPVHGPSGELLDAPDHAFHPASYMLHVDQELGTSTEEAGVEIVTGHDRMHPGRLPAKVFRLATMMLIILWATGLALPFGVFREFMTKPLTADIFVGEIEGGGEGAAEKSHRPHRPSHSGKPVLEASKAELAAERHHSLDNVPRLFGGEVLQVEWPSHSGFVPHSLSCDSTGMHLVVADDLGVYSGQLSWMVSAKASAQVAAAARTLLDVPSPVVQGLPGRVENQVLGVHFGHLAPCAALEGQALKDISVVCTGAAAEESCRVVVLHARGRRLAQCPLAPAKQGEDADQEAFKPLLTWRISSDWLHRVKKSSEQVESFAVNSACLDSDDAAPSGEVGCVVVGTTSGRIVQLRGAHEERSRLIPERALQQRHRTVGRGSLHVFSNGLVVALRQSSNTVEAFSSELGTMVGQWRLPNGVNWMVLCGGGDSLFVLGLRDGRHLELHRFPLPAELKVGPVQNLEPLSQLGVNARINEI